MGRMREGSQRQQGKEVLYSWPKTYCSDTTAMLREVKEGPVLWPRRSLPFEVHSGSDELSRY